MATYLPSYKPSKENEQEMLGTAGEVKTNSQVMSSYGLLHTNVGQTAMTYMSFVRTLDSVKRIHNSDGQ